MTIETGRHRFVKKLSITSVFVTAFFGFGSIFYVASQNRYEESLELRKNIRAVQISSLIDLTLNFAPQKALAIACKPADPNTCKSLIEYLIRAINRIEDYKIIATNTFKIKGDSDSAQSLQVTKQRINDFSYKYFGIKLEAFDQQNFTTIDQFIKLMPQNYLPANTLYPDFEQLNSRIIFSITKFRDRILSQSTTVKPSGVLISLGILISLEILLFLCVNTIDITNNNADPEKGYEFNPRKIQAKVRPLALSIVLAFAVMVATQLILVSENKRIQISHCRDVNQQDIQFLALIQTYSQPIKTNSLLEEFKISEFCGSLIAGLEKEHIQELNKLELSINSEETIEVKNEIARIYADSFAREEENMSSIVKTILLSSLIFNVVSMAMLSLFLRMDSADIG